MASAFDATASLLGYLFQVRVALLDSLKRLRNTPQFIVRIEALDDVSFETGTAIELLQVKHHITKSADLTDSGPDIWRTLRVWMTGRADGTVPFDAILFLATTSTAASGTGASYLRAGPSRDPQLARQRLLAAAQTSASAATKIARDLFRQMPTAISSLFSMRSSS